MPLVDKKESFWRTKAAWRVGVKAFKFARLAYKALAASLVAAVGLYILPVQNWLPQKTPQPLLHGIEKFKLSVDGIVTSIRDHAQETFAKTETPKKAKQSAELTPEQIKKLFKPGLIKETVMPFKEDAMEAVKFYKDHEITADIIAVTGLKSFTSLILHFVPKEYRDEFFSFGFANEYVQDVSKLTRDDIKKGISVAATEEDAVKALNVLAEVQYDLSHRYTEEKHIKIVEETLNIFPESVKGVVMAILAREGQNSIAEHVQAVRKMETLGDVGLFYYKIMQKLPQDKVADAVYSVTTQFNGVSGSALGKRLWDSAGGFFLNALFSNTADFVQAGYAAVEKDTLTDIKPKLAHEFADSAKGVVQKVCKALAKEKIDIDTPLNKLASELRPPQPALPPQQKLPEAVKPQTQAKPVSSPKSALASPGMKK